MAWTRTLVTEADTGALAQALAAQAELKDAFLALHGDLGAGKTTFVRYLLRALGVQGRIKSPTYAVVEPYQLATGPAWHFDFYRFADPSEWADAGFRDIFAGAGLKLAEWPERAQPHLPTPDLDLSLSLAEQEVDATDGADPVRIALLRAGTERGERLLAGLAAWSDTAARGMGQP